MMSDTTLDNGWVTTYQYTGDYLVINNKIYPLFNVSRMNANDHHTYFKHDDDLLVYDPQRDGPTIDKVEAKEKYPEYFV